MCFQIRMINAETDITLTIDIVDKTSVINYCTSKTSQTNNLLSLKQITNNKLKWCENLLIVTGSNNQLMKCQQTLHTFIVRTTRTRKIDLSH